MKDKQQKSAASLIRRRLIFLGILSLFLVAVLIWVSVALFTQRSPFAVEPFSSIAQGLGLIDTLLPRLL